MTEEIEKIGYSPQDARARVCQAVVLKAIANSNLLRNVTFKVVALRLSLCIRGVGGH